MFASTKPTIQGVWIVCLGQGLEGYRLKKVYFRGVSRVLLSSVETRAVESKSLEVGKSLKIGKNRIKSEKSELIFY